MYSMVLSKTHWTVLWKIIHCTSCYKQTLSYRQSATRLNHHTAPSHTCSVHIEERENFCSEWFCWCQFLWAKLIVSIYLVAVTDFEPKFIKFVIWTDYQVLGWGDFHCITCVINLKRRRSMKKYNFVITHFHDTRIWRRIKLVWTKSSKIS